jgi:hypothetical protein
MRPTRAPRLRTTKPPPSSCGTSFPGVILFSSSITSQTKPSGPSSKSWRFITTGGAITPPLGSGRGTSKPTRTMCSRRSVILSTVSYATEIRKVSCFGGVSGNTSLSLGSAHFPCARNAGHLAGTTHQCVSTGLCVGLAISCLRSPTRGFLRAGPAVDVR